MTWARKLAVRLFVPRADDDPWELRDPLRLPDWLERDRRAQLNSWWQAIAEQRKRRAAGRHHDN